MSVNEFELISRIVDRACELGIYKSKERVSAYMDLEFCVGIVDFERLLVFTDFNFIHDVSGIKKHMDRTEYPGTLMPIFSPRSSRS